MPLRQNAVTFRTFYPRTFAAALAVALLLATQTQSQAGVEPKRVLMLHSFGLRFKPWTDYAQAIRNTRQSPTTVDFQDHSLVTARLNGDNSDRPFVSIFTRSIVTGRPT